MTQQEWFMVKHAVTGLGLANSKSDSLSYRYQKEGTGFMFTVTGLDQKVMDNIMALRHELNVFRFVQRKNQPLVKHWYYVQGDRVQYDGPSHTLTIYADSEIRYVPEDYFAD
ncbi:hypothetical protein JNUCC31_12160 [Paenibacillus sp. JNUCC31]|uniref:hypothetical protein n=1 Tax=Paenibacillus sp. JNUCC-31 TaxID=2777983 RepID=UPI0017848D28|nr:hypothetical protein [Paenibacillus sp. JNUCC-31]QOS81530.1 hypothetical protein JNUCC31_12160 [Paenibacillus sp. JNUCC-31]